MISNIIKVTFRISDILSWIACLFFGALAIGYPFLSSRLGGRDPSCNSTGFIITVVTVSIIMTALFYLNTRRKVFASVLISIYFLFIAFHKATAMHYSISAAIILIITTPVLLSYIEMKRLQNA